MADVYFEEHPTDPEKVVLRKKPRIDQGPDYERGFVDGMQYQMQSRVDKAINRMAQPEQEPVAWMEGESVYWHTNQSLNDWIRANGTPLYTAPPQRTWVGLTGFEQKELMAMNARDAVFATEAKLREKNT